MGLLNFLFDNKKSNVQDFLKRDALILDVRTKTEWDAGHIENAIHIPLADLKMKIGELKEYDRPFVVYCESGGRSGKAVDYLTQNNFEAINGGGYKGLSKIIG
ncbi:MAG: rhodanese-like domain-containing protein [Bacteroidota bacterium]